MTSMPLIGASETAIAFGVSLALYLLVAGPVLAVCFYAIARKPSDATERAVADVERFIELRERARTELAASGSLDRFIELKDEARRHLWQPASERAHPERRSSKPETPPVSQIMRDRKSTRLNSSHITISYAVFCLKKKKTKLVTADQINNRKNGDD